jgi:hypothetical protein
VTAYNLRYIQLKKVNFLLNPLWNDEIRSIEHYAFKMWDDHTIPTNKHEPILDIYGTVLTMRRCRDKMIQNETS